ncbi:MAG: NAD-dependent deacylase [Melioribacteraceae bacterium]|nr:NAD-dependent deacylase [Melioribacteraceae bacterium]MCF8265095.1 NAD-dependent deacylase [Melioribacteraceae bacterium]MCF8413214.1 NAD-dependent deacylase [Melioribacteraceae bacterium]MCF8431181.1 NAD-dependent deacylase [Melioribacteraceae bacterium]
MEVAESLIQQLKNASRIVFFTGAGISAESGISTFRGKDGLWQKLKPEELANFDAFLNNPKIVQEWYQHRRDIIHSTNPNPGHFAIAEFEKIFDEVTVVTQNVDNLHKRAGSSNILELHGNIERNYCIECGNEFIGAEFDYKTVNGKCKCGGLIRPDVVWFGEMLPYEIFSEAEKKAAESDICFVVGTSAVVYPAANIPLRALHNGSVLVEVNIESTDISSLVHHSLLGRSGEILPIILEMLGS